MKPICFIAARAGSRGIPNKNIKIIGGKPLIAHTIEKAIKSKIFSHVIVSTDSKKIANISKKYGATVPFIRPKELSSDHIDIANVLKFSLKKVLFKKSLFEIFSTLFNNSPS